MHRPSHRRPLSGVGLPPLPGDYARRQRPSDLPPPIRHRQPRLIDIPPHLPTQLSQLPNSPYLKQPQVDDIPITVPAEVVQGMVGPIWDLEIRPTLETAREAEARGLHQTAASAYRGAVEIYREIGAAALPDTTAVGQLICGYGLLRCGDETKIDDYTLAGREVLDSVIPIILESDFALSSLKVQAEMLESPLIEEIFSRRGGINNLRENNFQLFIDPVSRNLLGEI